jgi:hypothetical protein
MADTERLTVDIPADVKRTLKAEAALADLTMGEATTDALRDWFAWRRQQRARDTVSAAEARPGH